MTDASRLARWLLLVALCCLAAVAGWPAEAPVSVADVVRGR